LLLEITETKRLDDLETAARSIDALREAGFLVCLDDFGAGAASLDYLRALSVDFVKFDGRFIRDLAEGGRDAVLLKHLVKLCEELGVQTVAEVVETRATADVARKLGVVFGQGWVFGKPGPTLSSSQTRPSVAALRRSGMVETWG
jgi:EAL domain-containing protein (putative c-di-GMP-specific phosphodiesterase class I)